MNERANKLYKPAELVAAQKAPTEAGCPGFKEASAIVVALHKLGFRIVHVGRDEL